MKLFPAVKPTILVVDDAPANLSLMTGLLYESYTVKAANHGSKALRIASEDPPDLILLDVTMPDIDGYEVCRRLKLDPHTKSIPVMFLTNKQEPESEERGMNLGAIDYIVRPISPAVLMSRVKAHLADFAQNRALRVNNEYLEYEVLKRARQISALQDVTTLALASLAETRDVDTGNHLRRTQHYVQALARYLRHHPRYAHYLNDNSIQILFKCSPLHDIGKVGIPDRVLLKPGRFDEAEMAIMKQHPVLGYQAISRAQQSSDASSEFMETAKEIVYSHHEKWDGSGYPQGLCGDEIPISARLMALADVYDALISRRVYKPAMSHDDAVIFIAEAGGSHFDPAVVSAFIAIEAEFQAIAWRFSDTDAELQEKAEALSSMLPIEPVA